MPINQQQQEKLFHWLKVKDVACRCPLCEHEGWQAGDVLAPPSAPGGGGTAVGGPSFPMVQVVCENCAHVMHFASTKIGLDL